MYCAATVRALPSSIAASKKRQAHLSSLPKLRRGRNAKTDVGTSHVCHHTVQERQILGTWCMPELNKAVEKGYKILQIHKVWHFPEKQTRLFADYVNTWLKIKEEASGWPEHVGENSAKQQQYIADYYAKEKIQLEPAKIQKNPGLRTLAKMMLNSMWGNSGRNPTKHKSKNSQILWPSVNSMKATSTTFAMSVY